MLDISDVNIFESGFLSDGACEMECFKRRDMGIKHAPGREKAADVPRHFKTEIFDDGRHQFLNLIFLVI